MPIHLMFDSSTKCMDCCSVINVCYCLQLQRDRQFPSLAEFMF